MTAVCVCSPGLSSYRILQFMAWVSLLGISLYGPSCTSAVHAESNAQPVVSEAVVSTGAGVVVPGVRLGEDTTRGETTDVELAQVASLSTDAVLRNSVVRVVLRDSAASGFFVEAPDGALYVATVFHAVDSGGPIRVERWIDISSEEHFVEAYPETRVVATDERADLALIGLVNVPRDRMRPLPLGTPRKDSKISSWGFPASSLVESLGLAPKDGRLSSIVRVAATDHRTGTMRELNAVPAIVVSTDLEPGFSGGPTVDEEGLVVGVNVLKDNMYRGQNAAVHVDELRSLLASVRRPAVPSTKEVERLLNAIQSNYLTLPVSERLAASEFVVIGGSELPAISAYATTMQGLSMLRAIPGMEERIGRVGRAQSALPGRTFPTTNSSVVRSAVGACEEKAAFVSGLFGGGDDLASVASGCHALLVRPLVWDFAASALRWDGKLGQVTVASVETLDERRGLYRARVLSSGSETTFPVELCWDYGALRLRLFNDNGRPVMGSQFGATDSYDSFEGYWSRREEDSLSESETYRIEERLHVRSVGDGSYEVSHDFVFDKSLREHNAVYPCNLEKSLRLSLEQHFTLEGEGSSLVGEASRRPTFKGDLCGQTPCEFCPYESDSWVRLKRIGDKLVVYRASGSEWPAMSEFRRKP